MVGKPPRKQRSSRFIVTEKVDIERLAPFLGLSLLIFLALITHFFLETPPAERPQLFIKKLHQCRVLFDFNDASADLKGKQIKAQTLHEMLEYITTQRGVVTDAVYPEVVGMVSLPNFPFFFYLIISVFSLPPTSSARYPLPSIPRETLLTQRKTNLS
jgi:serine/threonine-protein phosphatase 2A regulatory subunit B'